MSSKRIGLLPLLLAMIMAIPAFSYAAETSGPNTEEGLEYLLFGEISVVGVSKKTETFKEVPMSVYVISNDELNRWGVRQLYEIFQRIPGYSFYNTDYYGQYGPIGRGLQSIWRYGCSFELMNVVDFGHMTFTPAFFKSIEVARGPAGLMWGSGAEAGLMNFNIRDDLQGSEAQVEVGNSGRQAYTYMYGGKFENAKEGDGFFIGWHGEEQDPDTQKNAFDQPGQIWKMNGENFAQNLIGKIKYKDFKFTFFQDHADHIGPKLWFGDAGLQNALEAFQGDMHDQLEVVSYRAEYHLPIQSENYQLYFYHDYYKKQWWTESVALDTQRKRTFGFNAEAKIGEKVNINLGGDLWGQDQITAPSMTAYWARTWGINWYDTNLSPAKSEFRNLFIQGEVSVLENLKVILGGRADYQKDAEPDQTIYSGPRVGLLYKATDTLSFKYLYNSTKRRPQANESGSNVGPEQLVAHDVVAMIDLANKLKLDLTLFTQKLTDEITRVNDPSLLNAFYNTGGIETKGFEWALKYMPMEKWIIYWNGSYQQAEVDEKVFAGGVTVSEAHNSDDKPLFVPELTSFIGTEVTLGDVVRVNLALRTINSIPYITAAGGEDEASVNFVDFTLRSKKFFDNKFELDFNVLNLLDNDDRVPSFGEHAGNTTGTLQPEGRKFYARAIINF
jgi:outer membrane receptor protein involved in Fe transport